MALVALAPLLALAAVAIKLDSRGPVLYRQPRCGYGGRYFTLYKFRSMHVGSELELGADGGIRKVRDDERVTRIGRWLRRFSLDEAPQLVNVLRGDMSLVGPRPLVSEEAEALALDRHANRADLRPGLNGPVADRRALDHPLRRDDRVRLPVRRGLVARPRPEILLATIPAVISGRGAY